MGIFSRFFKRNKKNLIEVLTEIMLKEEQKKHLLQGSPFLSNKLIELNKENIVSFIIAELCFEIDTNPKFQSLRLKKEYLDIIENQKNNKSFQLLHQHMHQYYNGDPDLNTALSNLTYAFLSTVWQITEKIPDPILIATYSAHLSQVRGGLSKIFSAGLTELKEN